MSGWKALFYNFLSVLIRIFCANYKSAGFFQLGGIPVFDFSISKVLLNLFILFSLLQDIYFTQ